MFLGLEFLLGAWVITGAAAAAANNIRRNENNNDPLESFNTIHTTNYAPTPSYSVGSSSTSGSSSSSVHANPSYFEKRTIWAWWANGLESEEREILLENGYSDISGCFSLEELKSTSERMFAEKAPGRPTEKDGFKPDKKKGDKLVKNPNGKGKGWLDEKGEVWVPTGEGAHGGPHWDVQNPRTGGHRNVYPRGRVRY